MTALSVSTINDDYITNHQHVAFNSNSVVNYASKLFLDSDTTNDTSSSSFIPYLMAMSAASLLFRDSLDSVKSSYSYIKDSEKIFSKNTTSLNLNSESLNPSEISSLKQAVIFQLSRHPNRPAVYISNDGSNIVEFYNHINHFVFIADDDGVQFLWKDKGKTNSHFIIDKYLSQNILIENVSQLMPELPQAKK